MIFRNIYLGDNNISSIVYNIKYDSNNFDIFGLNDDNVIIKNDNKVKRLKLDGKYEDFAIGFSDIDLMRARTYYGETNKAEEEKLQKLEATFEERRKLLTDKNKIGSYTNSKGFIEVRIKMNNGDEFNETFLHWKKEFMYSIKDKSVISIVDIEKKYDDIDVDINFIFMLIHENETVSPNTNFNLNKNKVFI